MSKYAIFGTDAEGVETIKGNGWDINSERIELNGINAELICEDDYRCVSMNGPAVEDIFKCLHDLIKENKALAEKNERLTGENYTLTNYCDAQRKIYKTEMDKRDCYIKSLKTKIEKRTERNRELEEEIKIRDEYMDCLETTLDEKTENYDRLQDLYLKEINKQNALRERVRELEEEKTNAAVTNYCMNDVITAKNMVGFQPKSFNECDATRKVYDRIISSPDEIYSRSQRIIEGSSYRDTDITHMYPSTYSDAAKEVLGWIDGEMKNGTDYATKIFNKEDAENIFSITFCKVPVESKEDE